MDEVIVLRELKYPTMRYYMEIDASDNPVNMH